MWAVREWQNHKAQKDLMDRLMSRDFTEYARGNRPNIKAAPARLTDAEMAEKEKAK